jgi:PEGA domain
MSKVIWFVVCGFTLAACSGSPPDLLKTSAATTALRFESVPRGAEVKVSGQTCRTPCELKLEVAELSATFALKGYQPQTVAVHSSPLLAPPQFTPNPVHADLRPVGTSARRQLRNETPLAAGNPRGAVSAEVTTSSNEPPNKPQTSPVYGAVQ